MQQVWFLILCLGVSVAYSTLGNADDSPNTMLITAAWYFLRMVAAFVAIAWVIYAISP